MLLTAAAIIVGVLVVAIGRGGEMTTFPSDTSPVQAEVETAADIALLRPPWALWGYQMRATDEVFGRIAQSVTERDVEIATLRRQLAELRLEAAQQTTAGRQEKPARNPVSGEPTPAGQATGVQQAAASRPPKAGRSTEPGEQQAGGRRATRPKAAGRHTEPGQQQAAGRQQRGVFEPMQEGSAAKDDEPSPPRSSPGDPR
jgi:hypothetical protein